MTAEHSFHFVDITVLFKMVSHEDIFRLLPVFCCKSSNTCCFKTRCVWGSRRNVGVGHGPCCPYLSLFSPLLRASVCAPKGLGPDGRTRDGYSEPLSTPGVSWCVCRSSRGPGRLWGVDSRSVPRSAVSTEDLALPHSPSERGSPLPGFPPVCGPRSVVS